MQSLRRTAPMMSTHKVVEDVYGPGTFVDEEFMPLPVDCRRLLRYMAQVTPGFRQDEEFLDAVEFSGQDLPIIPGPLKSQALVNTGSLLRPKQC